MKRLARLLNENHFLDIISSSIEDIFDVYAITSQDILIVRETSPGASPSPRKDQPRGIKRKLSVALSSEDELQIPSARHDALFMTGSIGGAVSHCVELAQNENNNEKVSSLHMRLTLRYSPQKSASLIGKLIMVQAMIITKVESNNSAMLEDRLRCAQNILVLWDYRSHGASTRTDNGSDQAFVQHCLKAALALLMVLESCSTTKARKAPVVNRLERLIALHAVYPARALFFEELASSWGAVDDPIALRSIQSVVAGLHDNLSLPEITKVGTDGTALRKVITLLPLLLEITVRATPRASVRQRQHEQPWLEAMLTTLVQASSPFTDDEGLMVREATLPINQRSSSRSSRESTVRLLDIALRHKITVSLPLLSRLAKNWLKDASEDTKWHILARYMKLDVNIFIPNSGISTAPSLLKNLCENIAALGRKDNQLYDLIKNDIILPLMHGFSQARDLRAFVDLWRSMLEPALHQQIIDSHGSLEAEPYQVWEDEDISATFCELAKTAVTPTLVRRLLTETIAGMQATDTDASGPTKLTAHAIVIDSILTSRAADCALAAELTLELVETTCRRLKEASKSRYGRWRLWRILRRCIAVLPSAKIPRYVMALGGEQSSAYVSLSSVSAILISEHSLEKQSHLLEAVECFHLLTVQIATNPSSAEQLRAELVVLASYLVTLSKREEEGTRPLASLWDGRARSLASLTDLVTACFGIIMQNSQVILQANVQIEGMLQAMLYCVFRNSETEGAQSRTTSLFWVVQAFLASEQVHSNSKLMHGIFDAIYQTTEIGPLSESAVRALLSMPLQDFSKALMGRLADKVVDELSRGGGGGSNRPDILELKIALIDKIVERMNVSIGMPQQWVQLADLAVALHRNFDTRDSKSYRFAAQVIQRMFGAMWKRALDLAGSTETKKLFLEMMSWCNEIIFEESFSYGLSRFLVLRGFLNGFWHDREMLSYVVSEDELRRSREAYSEKLILDLSALCKSQDTHGVVLDDVGCVIRSLSQCSDLCKESTKLKYHLANAERALGEWKASLRPALSASPLRLGEAYVLERNQQRLNRVLWSNDDELISKDGMRKLLLQFAEFAEPQLMNMTGTETLHQCLQSASDIVSSLGKRNIRDLIHLLRSAEINPQLGLSRLLVIGALFATADTSSVMNQPDTISDIVELTESLSSSMSHTIQQFCLSADCIKMVLERYPGIVGQWTFDNLLSSINVMVSRDAPNIDGSDNTATAIFGRLCSLVGVLLGQHRKRLGGRHHLLLPTIHRLMRCLFAPKMGTTANDTDFAATFPSWIRRAQVPLGTQAATQFARLLTTICDPTASSVKKSKHWASNGLTDETKRAKSMASHYMQYVIMQYARCQLESIVSPETKAALMPGLYAVLSVMSRDEMRAMNAAMDASSRAIFKGLYDDFQKFGIWNQS